jgi:hypothetical protein
MRSRLISLTVGLSVLVSKATSIGNSLFGDAELPEWSSFDPESSPTEETWALLDIPPSEGDASSSQDAFDLFDPSLQSPEPVYPDTSASLWEDELPIIFGTVDGSELLYPDTSPSLSDEELAINSFVQDEIVDDSSQDPNDFFRGRRLFYVRFSYLWQIAS